MKEKTNYLKIFITSIYDINVFSKYAKEGLRKAIIYILLLSIGLGMIKGGMLGYKITQGVNYTIKYLQSSEKKIYIEDGILNVNFNYEKVNKNIFIDINNTIEEETDFKEIFLDNNINLLILKDGIAFNNYGSIYAVNYSDIFKNKNIDKHTISNGANIFNVVIIGVLILLNIIEILKDLIFNYIIIVTAALLVSMLMKMVVKYKALWSIVIYASTLPLIVLTILNILEPNVNFDFVFIGGTLTYIIITLMHIKDEIIQKISQGRL